MHAHYTEYEDLLDEDYEMLEENLGVSLKVNFVTPHYMFINVLTLQLEKASCAPGE